MTEQEYFSERVNKDIYWYEKRARLYRFLHIYSRIFIIISSAILTILASATFAGKDLVIAILSSAIVIVTSISELLKFKDQWFDYRITVENIKSETALFSTGTDPYDKGNKFNLFVKNFEMIVRSENQKWSSYISGK